MKRILVTIVLLIAWDSFGQVKKKDQEVDIITHEVKLGESVRLLSKKYLVDPAEIYKLNKFAVEGIKEGMVLQIPVPRKAGVPAKETGVSKEAAVTDETEQKEKPQAVTEQPVKQESVDPGIQKVDAGIKKQEPVSVSAPAGDIKQIIITEDKTEVNHKVLPKETLYSLSRDYNVTVDEIKANNPQVAKSGLQVGQVVKILTSRKVDIKQSNTIVRPVTKSQPVQPTTAEVKTDGSAKVIRHQVQPKETLYSLSKKYNVTVDQIKEQNAQLLINGLQIGQVLEIKPNN